MKNKDEKLKEIQELQVALIKARQQQKQIHELIQLYNEIQQIKMVIDDYVSIHDQTKLEIVKRSGRD